MKTKYFLLLLIIGFHLTSCENEFPISEIDTSLEIIVQDENGSDLLDPNNLYPKSINTDRIEVIYLVNGNNITYDKINQGGWAKFYLIDKTDNQLNKFSLDVLLNHEYTNSTTYIKWNKTDTDTIEAIIKSDKSSIICTQIKLNSTIVWNIDKDYSNNKRIITITK